MLVLSALELEDKTTHVSALQHGSQKEKVSLYSPVLYATVLKQEKNKLVAS